MNTVVMNSSNTYPLVTIITIVSNNVNTIRNAVQSIAYQDYENIEHIVIDNCSTDGTLEAVNEQVKDLSLVISEPDKGIYYALNKGIELSHGEIIGFLNSDDVLKNRKVITNIVYELTSSEFDAVYGDLQYFSKRLPNKISRIWRAGIYSKSKLEYGWMPPHPTFYTYKELYVKYGYFDVSYQISSDYDMMLKLLYQNNLRAKYIPKVLVKMQSGGISNSLQSLKLKAREDYIIMKKNNFSFITLLYKTLRKLGQFIILIK